jgi:hypothetical protein
VSRLEEANTALLIHVHMLEEEKAGLEQAYAAERKTREIAQQKYGICLSEKSALQDEQEKMHYLFEDILLFLPYDQPDIRDRHNLSRWKDERNGLLTRLHEILGLERS